jgi:2-polyprenyl-3-methyl-5-hydroxy-6-metoxy-1,4-benzoquinol methylase
MIYVNPVLRQEKLHSDGLREDSWIRVLCNETQLEMDRKKFRYGLDLLETYQPGRGRLLDVGTGPGVFLEVARERGWEVSAVEFNQACVERLRELGIPVTSSTLEEAQFEKASFRAVTLWDVLEHILEPRSFLRHVRALMAPEGILMVALPNVDSLVCRVLHEKSATFAGDSHVNFFNAETLKELLGKCGFEVLESETFLTEIGTINNHLSFEDVYLGGAQTVLEFLTPEYIHRNMLGSRLLVLAQWHDRQ